MFLLWVLFQKTGFRVRFLISGLEMSWACSCVLLTESVFFSFIKLSVLFYREPHEAVTGGCGEAEVDTTCFMLSIRLLLSFSSLLPSIGLWHPDTHQTGMYVVGPLLFRLPSSCGTGTTSLTLQILASWIIFRGPWYCLIHEGRILCQWCFTCSSALPWTFVFLVFLFIYFLSQLLSRKPLFVCGWKMQTANLSISNLSSFVQIGAKKNYTVETSAVKKLHTSNTWVIFAFMH